MASNKPNKLAFLSMPAPASYVAGLVEVHRGSQPVPILDLREDGPSAEVIAEAQARRGEEAEVDPDQFQDPDNEYGLFAGTTYEQDDEEADKIYQQVDEAMDARRRARREAQEQIDLAKHRAERPKIQQQFADLKRGLSAVTDEEWETLPEVGNLTRKKRRKMERSFAVPDSILVGDRSKSEYENSLDDRQQQNGGFETPAESGTLTNFVEIGQARDKILSLKLDQISGTATSGTSTSVDPKGYLTSLNSVVLKSDAEIGDIKRARMLFDSLVKSNPKHSPGWIAAACLEEHAGRMVAARKIIKVGCEQCPKSEDVWLEAARLHNNDDAKVILANAVQHVGQSVKIWMAAADLEHDLSNIFQTPSVCGKKQSTSNPPRPTPGFFYPVLSKSSPSPSNSGSRFARLESPERAKSVLNKARKAVPTSHEIWIAAGRLLEQEARNKSDAEREAELAVVDKTIVAGVKELRRHQVLLTREQWLKEAERCETEGSPRTCEAIVKATVGMEIEEEDRLDTWVGDAESAEARGMVGTARAILAEALRVFPGRKSLWIRAAELEKANGTRESLDAILSRAVDHCPQAEVLWLMAAKEKWMAGDVPAAREVLERAFVANKESEQIWLAAVKLEAENNELGVARELLVRARTVADTERIWMKSAVFERQQGQLDAALETLATALTKFPKFAKLYMIQGQILQSQGKFPAARASFAAGLKACPKEPTLWILASRLEEADKKSIKARAILEKARLVNPANDVLWAEAVGVEERSGGAAQGKAMLARSLQECPTSGLLWSMSIWAEPRPMRKARSVDALKKSADNPVIICTVARLFWAERKIEKARQWFGRAVATDPDLGDSWGLVVEEHREDVRKKCVAAEPHHSPMWQSGRKRYPKHWKSIAQILELVADALAQ
ncbi:PRP1 splicing factor, N-terminal-domain-containing protein [Mycena olivaceomarginata]|nr:PRP1 splicing factor, N-terminal-domain-containing protein [Mycena olivaceomarginata]